MSAFFDTAQDIAGVLVNGLPGVPVLIDRQRDIRSEVTRLGLQAKGGLIIVGFVGATRKEENAPGPRFEGSYMVTHWTKPIIHKDETPADDTLQRICQLLDWHIPTINGVESHFNNRWIVTGAMRFDDPDTSILVHRVSVQIPLQLPKLR